MKSDLFTCDHAPLTVKFCGLTRRSDIDTAIALGADAVGLVFYPPSPRHVSIATAKSLTANLPPFVSIIALVVNMPEADFVDLCRQVPFDVVQFHGNESAEECAHLAALGHKRWYKAIRVQDEDDVDGLMARIHELHVHGASAVLLDAYHPHKFGGTGQCFDWAKIPQSSPLPIVLAGGLSPTNVADVTSTAALRACLYGLDVSGGIETSHGIKCPAKMSAFMQAVHRR